MQRSQVALMLLFALTSCQKDSGPQVDISADRIAAHVKFLSDDLLEGRGVATRGEALATAYIASQFAQFGLAPAGDNGTFFQRVPLVGVETLDSSTLAINGRPLQFLTEFVGVNDRQQPEAS